jgi:hypothetical protein
VDSIDRRLAVLRETGARMEQELTAVTLHPHARVRGTDASGRVSIEWEGEDPRLVIAEGWEREIAAADLPTAVAEAMSAALAARYADDGIRIGDEDVERPVAHLDAPTLGAGLAADPRFAAAIRRPDFAERLSVLLAEAGRRAGERRRATGPDGAVSVDLDHAGGVSGYRIDPDAAAGRSGAALTADAAAATAHARARFASDDPRIRPLTENDVIEELMA